MAMTIRKLLPRRIRRKTRFAVKGDQYPYELTITGLVPQGCKFEIAGDRERRRVVGLGNEEGFVRLLLDEIQSGDIFFDVGSCVGLFALHAAVRGAKVIAFEPDPGYRKRLTRNIRKNKLKNSIKVVEWAVSDKKGVATLYTDGVEGGQSPSLVQVGKRGSVIVDTDSIDSAIANRSLPLPTMVKLDIEGAEILALRGMKDLFGSPDAPRCLFVELHPEFLPGFGSTAKECINLIESFGYFKEYSHIRDKQLHCIYRKRV